MPDTIRLLIVEDSEDDALLLVRHLRRSGCQIEFQRVASETDMRQALASGEIDLVITDHVVPGFGSMEALGVAREVAGDLPVIIVSGTIGEEHAVDAMLAGARDYIMKDALARLAPAVLREMDATKVRSAQREAERVIAHMAFHDPLTGLDNRAAFERELARILDQARDERSHHALAYLDLDQFKVINDTCGHVAGDELLRQVARLLREQIRQRDTLARLGGDEFGLLMEHCSIVQAERICRKLCARLEDFHFAWEGQVFRISVSIGVVAVDSTGGSLTSVLSAADSACYAAKERGRNRVHVYREDDEQLMQRRSEMQWVSTINQALTGDGLRLYRQHIEPLSAPHSPAGHMEFLLRMPGAGGELVMPGAFLPAAERYGLASKIDRWVVTAVLHWLEEHADGVGLCGVNLSGQSLGDRSFFKFVTDALRGSTAAPERICFEITETSAIANLADAVTFIRDARDLGCRFALDDFGSGMASFAYLKTLPVEFLKIDGTFVRDIVEDSIDRALVRSINDIGHVMGKQTIAEYVETQPTCDLLRDMGVDFAQGYLFGQPRPA